MKPCGFLAILLCAALLAPLCAPCALAAQNNFYIIPDSDVRYLTEEELWGWQYEAVGYIYNEIFARHGRSFRAGQKYDRYFRSQAWYQVNPNYRYGMLNGIEIANEQLAHEVLQDMRAQKTTNRNGRPLPASDDDAGLSSAFSFRAYNLIGGQKLAVYSGPGEEYYRAANGRAAVSTNGGVRIAGSEGGWLLIEYDTSGGSRRVGYIWAAGLRDRLNVSPLSYYAQSAVITASRCRLTDDPNGTQAALMTLPANTPVTLLGQYTGSGRTRWSYIEVESDAGPMRGFVPAQSVSATDGGAYDWDDESGSSGDNG